MWNKQINNRSRINTSVNLSSNKSRKSLTPLKR